MSDKITTSQIISASKIIAAGDCYHACNPSHPGRWEMRAVVGGRAVVVRWHFSATEMNVQDDGDLPWNADHINSAIDAETGREIEIV